MSAFFEVAASSAIFDVFAAPLTDVEDLDGVLALVSAGLAEADVAVFKDARMLSFRCDTDFEPDDFVSDDSRSTMRVAFDWLTCLADCSRSVVWSAARAAPLSEAVTTLGEVRFAVWRKGTVAVGAAGDRDGSRAGGVGDVSVPPFVAGSLALVGGPLGLDVAAAEAAGPWVI